MRYLLLILMVIMFSVNCYSDEIQVGDEVSSASPAKKYESPILITSVGQSSDARIVKVLFEIKAKIPVSLEMMPNPDEFDLTKYKTIVAAVGGSNKGLGAAGVDVNSEVERAKKLLEKAKELKVPVVVMHTGGIDRRGEISQPFIDTVIPYADSIIVKSDGNNDKFFTHAAETQKIQIKEVDKLGDEIVSIIKEWFGASLENHK
jgi:hypothetical protein